MMAPKAVPVSYPVKVYVSDRLLFSGQAACDFVRSQSIQIEGPTDSKGHQKMFTYVLKPGQWVNMTRSDDETCYRVDE